MPSTSLSSTEEAPTEPPDARPRRSYPLGRTTQTRKSATALSSILTLSAIAEAMRNREDSEPLEMRAFVNTNRKPGSVADLGFRPGSGEPGYVMDVDRLIELARAEVEGSALTLEQCLEHFDRPCGDGT